MKRTRLMALVMAAVMALAIALPALADEAVPEVTLYLTFSGTTANADNPVLDAIEEATGVRLTVIQAAPGAEETKHNTMIASRELPDLFRVDNISDMQQFIEEGMVMPLDDLLAEYGPNILAEVGDILPQAPANQIDGNTYLMLSGSTDYTSNLNVRVDWLKNLGLEMPTDLDSLYDVLYAFTYDDPDGNGQQDTVGIVMPMAQYMQWDNLFGAFGICFEKNYLMEDGTVTTYMKAPTYLQAIEYLRKLYQNGVMDPDFATMPAMTAHERLWTGRCGVYGFQSVGPTNNWYPGRYTEDMPEDPAEVFGFANIVGPDGIGGSPKQYPNMMQGWVVSSTCENPEAAIRLMDYLYTQEGDELTYLGVEGLMYEWVDEENGVYRRLGEYTDDAIHRANGGYTYWLKLIEDNCEVRTLNTLTREGQELARANAIDHPVIYSALQSEIEYGTGLMEITREALAQLIVTTGDVEEEYNAFVERWNNEGGLEFEAEATAAWQAQQANQAQ